MTSDQMFSAATFHTHQGSVYRYHLARWWRGGSWLVWVMCNPSSAGAPEDDPTIRRVIDFTRRNDYLEWGGLAVVNLYGLVATDPAALAIHPDPSGPENDQFLREAIEKSMTVVAAWGAGIEAAPEWEQRADFVMNVADRADVPVMCLDETKAGHPKHPLYLPADSLVRSYRPGAFR